MRIYPTDNNLDSVMSQAPNKQAKFTGNEKPGLSLAAEAMTAATH